MSFAANETVSWLIAVVDEADRAATFCSSMKFTRTMMRTKSISSALFLFDFALGFSLLICMGFIG